MSGDGWRERAEEQRRWNPRSKRKTWQEKWLGARIEAACAARELTAERLLEIRRLEPPEQLLLPFGPRDLWQEIGA